MTIWVYQSQTRDMCMWEGVSVGKRARRQGIGNAAGSGGGRLGVFYCRFCDPVFVIQFLYSCPDLIYTSVFRGRALDFIYTNFRSRIYHVMGAFTVGHVIIRRFWKCK